MTDDRVFPAREHPLRQVPLSSVLSGFGRSQRVKTVPSRLEWVQAGSPEPGIFNRVSA